MSEQVSEVSSGEGTNASLSIAVVTAAGADAVHRGL